MQRLNVQLPLPTAAGNLATALCSPFLRGAILRWVSSYRRVNVETREQCHRPTKPGTVHHYYSEYASIIISPASLRRQCAVASATRAINTIFDALNLRLNPCAFLTAVTRLKQPLSYRRPVWTHHRPAISPHATRIIRIHRLEDRLQ